MVLIHLKADLSIFQTERGVAFKKQKEHTVLDNVSIKVNEYEKYLFTFILSFINVIHNFRQYYQAF